jgi:CheY-like chemotaxis protein
MGRSTRRQNSSTTEPRDERALRLDGLRVLVLEDKADGRTLLGAILRGLGAAAVLAENGRAGLSELARAQRRPDVILCDLVMPEMDGLAFAAHLRRNPAWARIPILAVTALGDTADYVRTWAHGFAGHLTKPIDEAQVASAIRRVVPVR